MIESSEIGIFKYLKPRRVSLSATRIKSPNRFSELKRSLGPSLSLENYKSPGKYINEQGKLH